MLASLRPTSPTEYSLSHRLHRPESLAMGSPNSSHFPPPPSQLRPESAGRPGITRQRSSHHPYAPSGRAPIPLDRSPDGQGRLPDLLPHTSPYRRTSATMPAEPYRTSTEARAGLSPGYSRTNFQLSPRLMLDGEQWSGVGPQRNRGRSSTLSMPKPNLTRPRGASFAIPPRAQSPTYATNYADHSPKSWDDHRARRGSFVQRVGDGFLPSRHSPPLPPPHAPSSHASSLLFAPLSTPQDPFAYGVGRPSLPQTVPRVDRAGVLRSRPNTPLSPLNMDGLSMEDSPYKAVTGLALPSAHQQRSPPDSRYREYVSHAPAHRSRVSHYEVDRNTAGSEPSPSEQRYEIREYAHHAPALPGVGATLHSGRDQPRFQSTFTSNHARVAPSPASSGSPALLVEHLDRERFAQTQAHPRTHGHTVYPPAGAEYPHPSRMRAASVTGLEGQQNPPIDRIAHSRRRRRPPYSYASMITQAISSSPEGRMTLREIYTWISTNFHGYPMAGSDSQGWQNTVRHNLSLGKIFVKKQRTAQDIYDSCSSGNPSQSQAARGKGGWWTLHPVVLEQIRSGQRTHSDEFDDVESMTELDSSAEAKSATTDPAASKHPQKEAGAPTLERTLSRQRSYSDSMGVSAASNFRRTLPGAAQSTTAPVSRQVSIRTGPVTHDTANSPVSSTPSVLQPRATPTSPFQGRMRSYTSSTTEVPVHDMDHVIDRHYVDGHEYERRDERRYESSLKRGSDDDAAHYGEVGAVTVPYTAEQAPRDVEMEPRDAMSHQPRRTLREAREELVSNRIQHIKQQQQHHLSPAVAADDSDDSTGRMNIRGLLNN